MRIGIIGAGRIGGTLARLLVDAGHEVGLSNAHGPESLRAKVMLLGRSACAMTVAQAQDFGDVVVLAIPFGRYREIPPRRLAGKIVIDATNAFPERDGFFPEFIDGATSSELMQEHLRDARLVKSFNTVRWDCLRAGGRPRGEPDRLAMPLAGDDLMAKRAVAGLIDELGFDPVDAGGLADGGRRLQPGSPLFTAHVTADEVRRRLAA
jgi:8-hydroxy-5-deazaflavin:NADPH oxidoreductase